MYCANCGTQLEEQAKFCSECGAAVYREEKSQTTIPTNPGSKVAVSEPKIQKGFPKWVIASCIIGVILFAYFGYMFTRQSVMQQPGFYQANQNRQPVQPGMISQRREIQLELESYNNGFFSMEKPKGWQVATGGYGSTFCYSVQDPNEPLRQILYFGEVGPAYLSVRQKQIDQAAINMGSNITWFDSPVVSPLTPENYLQKIPQILQGRFMRAVRVLPGPNWQNFQIVESTPHQTLFNAPDARCALIRALFTLNGRVGEGLFLVTVATLMPENGNPFVGTAYSVCFTAITAPQQEFRLIEAGLTRSVGSATLSPEYIAQATKNANSNWARIFAAGQTLRQTSDIITKGWDERNKTYDIISEKRADTIRGVERVYDPGTNQVYSVPNGWYDQYNLERNQYNKPNLQQVPADSSLYLNPALDGNTNIHK